MVAQREHQRLDLRFGKVHEDTFGQEQEGTPAMHPHRLQPGILEYRTAQQMIAPPFIANQLPAQLDDLRQIQVVPLDLAVALRDALKARIEAAADMNHYRVRVARQEIPRVAVVLAGLHDPHYLEPLVHRDLPDPGEVEALLPDQSHGLLVL